MRDPRMAGPHWRASITPEGSLFSGRHASRRTGRPRTTSRATRTALVAAFGLLSVVPAARADSGGGGPLAGLRQTAGAVVQSTQATVAGATQAAGAAVSGAASGAAPGAPPAPPAPPAPSPPA